MYRIITTPESKDLNKPPFKPDLNPYVARVQQHSDIIFSQNKENEQDRAGFFDLTKPIIVDLGCGSGNFLRDYARLYPEFSFYGFELRYKRLVKGALKFKKHNLSNVRLIQARAEDIAAWFPDGSIREVNINFPDPWPKRKQLKHRLMTPEFLVTLGRLLEKNGHFVFKTDHKAYFQPVAELIKGSEIFDIVGYTEDLHHSPLNEDNIQTEFEQLFRGKGYPIYYIKSKVR